MEKKTAEEKARIGKYKILSLIGEGGFGRVYRVFDPELQVERAVKVPFSQGEEVDRVLQEPQNQAKINHPAVIQVHGVENIDGRWVIIMDYAAGGSLRDRLTGKGPLGIDESLHHILTLAGALAEAHKKNILHYDIKPENILFDENGELKLADFGISRRMEREGKKMSRVIGTVEYMGPEQLNGIEDRRSEVWSLGAILYEMLTGEPCFKGESDSQIMKNIREGRFRPLRKANRSFPQSLERIVNKMLALNPDKRFQSMEEVIRIISEFLAMGGRGSRRALASLLFLFVLAAALVLGGGFFYADRIDLLDIPWLQKPREPEPVSIPASFASLGLEAQFEAANEEIHKGNYPLAYQMLKSVEEKAGDKEIGSRASFFKASLALNYLNDPDLAFQNFRSFLDRYPESPLAPDAHYFLGGIYYEKRHNLPKAIDHLTTLIEKYPTNNHVASAEFLVQDAAKQLAKEGSSVGLVMKSFMGGFLPNDWVPLMISLLGLLSSIGMPVAWIMSQYHQPRIANINSVRSGFREMMKHRVVRRLVFIVVISQLLSFVLTHYQSSQDYQKSASALERVGVHVDRR
jgi:serine/threonine protein kinase